jgi:hypothetical protein
MSGPRRTAHPPLDEVREGEGLQRLTKRWAPRLAAGNQNRIVLAHIFARHEAQFLRRGRGYDLPVLAAADMLHHVTARRADEHEELVHVFGTGEADAALLKYVEHLKFKAPMHRRIGDEPGGVEGIGGLDDAQCD